MVNHLFTLLLNEPASAVSAAGLDCDPLFEPVSATHAVSAVREALFSGTRGLDGRIAVAEACGPFLDDPEFDAFRGMFDRRSTFAPREVCVGTVGGFYRTMGRGLPGFVLPALRCGQAPMVFDHVGSESLDSALDSLRSRFSSRTETSRRFSALLYGVLVSSEHARASRLGVGFGR